MARYRSKDETDLVWNRIRRQITRDLDTRIQNFREELLNEALTAAWVTYEKALKTGDVLQLEDVSTAWVDEVIAAKLRPQLEAQVADLAHG